MMKRLLITGAAGGLGAMCRERLTHLAETIVVSDRDGLGEAAAHEEIMYCDKFGIETACVRIGACFPEPKNHRMLSMWMSYDDFVRLIERVFIVPRLGCPIVYGTSANSGVWWDNHEVAYLGWQPQDNAEVFRAKLDAELRAPTADEPNSKYQGGMFTADGIHEE